jgi:hypothetical protein
MTSPQVQLYGWCGPAPTPTRDLQANPTPSSFRSESAGYFAMVAFLVAYALNVSGTGRLVQVALNLSGALAAAIYLNKKHAVPSVISNLAWVAITIGGLFLR